MKTLTVKLAKSDSSYPIHISPGDFKHSFGIIKKSLLEPRLFVVTNSRIKNLFGKRLTTSAGRNLKIIWILIRDSEKNKNLSTCEKILTLLSHHCAQRQSMLLALGGGVIGDITGFVASIYMRGIAFFQMPTTLLAQVDSSIGGKTGVDLKTGKNLVGAFHQPKAVFIHTDFLKTLPPREIKCGLAEIIKHAIIADEKLFDYLNTQYKKILEMDEKTIQNIIHTSCKIKAYVVSRDEKEKNLRAILNFGHSLGHAVEVLTGYSTIKHGEAVASGMVSAAQLSQKMGFCQPQTVNDITQLLLKFGLPTELPKFAPTQYQKAILTDKKAGGTTLRFIVVTKIGKVRIVPLECSEIIKKLCLEK